MFKTVLKIGMIAARFTLATVVIMQGLLFLFGTAPHILELTESIYSNIAAEDNTLLHLLVGLMPLSIWILESILIAYVAGRIMPKMAFSLLLPRRPKGEAKEEIDNLVEEEDDAQKA